MEKTRPNNGNGYNCDWCGMSYPLGGWDYYQLVLFGKELKTICSDCYNHLHHITIEEQLHKPEVDSSQPLDVKQEGGNGVPPTPKGDGYPAYDFMTKTIGGKKMKDEIEIDGNKYVLASKIKEPAKKNTKGMEYCIVRTYSAGVFAGFYDRKTKGQEGAVYDAIRIWSWYGAASLSQLANEGVKHPDKCKFAMAVNEVLLKEIIEVIPCTQKAKENINGVKTWQI